MANRPDLDDDDDDDFSDIYKAYTGPLGTSAPNAQKKPQIDNKRPHSNSDEEDERDPNAVPTDFTSRDAKVWEAKSKATERNWKKRKEEEMICKICGESGHFTQGCPSTLGGNRNSQDFFERVAARDQRVRVLFTEKVIEQIQKDIGCKIRMDEKFIIVSGKDRLVLRKGVDAVHNVIKDEGNDKGSPHAERCRSSERNSNGASNRFSRPEPQRSNPSPRNTSQLPKFGRQRSLEDSIRVDLQKPSRNSPQAYGSDGGRGRPSHSRSPARVSYSGNSYTKYEAHRQGVGAYSSDGWETERRASDLKINSKFEQSSFPQTLEDLEMEYQREAMDLAKLRDQQLDEENYKHNENCRELRESHMKRLTALRGSHAKQWEDFLHLDAQRRRQQQAQKQQMPVTGFGDYHPSNYSDHHSLGGQTYLDSNFHREPRVQYGSPSENYPHSRGPRDIPSDFQRHRLEGYGRAYDRY